MQVPWTDTVQENASTKLIFIDNLQNNLEN